MKNHNPRLVSDDGRCLWPRDKGAPVPQMGRAASNWRQPDLPALEIGFAIDSVETSSEWMMLICLVCRKARCVFLSEQALRASMSPDFGWCKTGSLTQLYVFAPDSPSITGSMAAAAPRIKLSTFSSRVEYSTSSSP